MSDYFPTSATEEDVIVGFTVKPLGKESLK
jgi:hypothetical protein